MPDPIQHSNSGSMSPKGNKKGRKRFPHPLPPEACEEMLRQLPPKPSAEQCRPLVASLATEKWSLREKIAERLVLAGPVAVPALLEMLENGLWYSRAATLKALGRMGDWRALLQVLNACWDQNQTVSEDGLRAILGFCRRGFTLAVSKIVHSRGPVARDEFIERLEEIDAQAVVRFQRLWEEHELMGPEARLSKGEEKRITETVRDERWGLVWADLVPSEPLKLEKRSVMEALRGTSIEKKKGERVAETPPEKDTI